MTTASVNVRASRADSPKVVIGKKRSDIRIPPQDEDDEDFPRSRNKAWRHQLPVAQETSAIESLKVCTTLAHRYEIAQSRQIAWDGSEHDFPEYEGFSTRKEFMTADLDDFEIYTSPKQQRFPHELISLEWLDVRGKELLFDGVLSIRSTRRYVQGAPIKVYSVEGYGEDGSPSAVVYVQSQQASNDLRFDIWYRLKQPSHRYRRFHRVFHWVATLGKHTIDYLETRPEGALVGLKDFRHEFYQWITHRFRDNEEVNDWLKAFDGTDFRKSIHAHIDYLGQEAYNLNNVKALLKHPLWADCMKDDHHIIKPQPFVCEKTTTTPHTYLCFKNRYFAKFLEETKLSEEIRDQQEARKRLLGFPQGALPVVSRSSVDNATNPEASSLRVGDMVSILPDEVEERLWRKQAKDVALDNAWYAYIQKIERKRNGELRLFVIWMYRPEDTTISTTDYPIPKELFLSDHCNCQEPELLANEVRQRYTVDWYSKAMDTRSDCLVRKRYVTEDSSFVSLKPTDFQCGCQSPKFPALGKGYQRGDTIYIACTRGGEQILDPVVIDEIDPDENEVTVRRLIRLKDCTNIAGNITRETIADNELVWTNLLIKVSRERLRRRCHVRHFPRTDLLSRTVPFPYNRSGAGDYWVVSSQMSLLLDKPSIGELQEAPISLREGPVLDDLSPDQKLSGLSLFSGCGNLDKGLEEGGAVEFETSVEYCPEAVHSLHANAKHPDKLKLWLGSVDDYLDTLLVGKETRLVARIGEVAVIAAGSPCPGFSTLQQDWKSAKSLRNASHVTTFCSFVDVYRPKYAFLENVVNMACTRVGYEEERVLSQIIACLVSMGYQVQQFIMSAWNFGSPQHRSRLILSIAAPGLPLLTPPAITHSHPSNYRSRAIGDLLNGQKFGAQDEGPTPFPFVTVERATAHLPDIGTGAVQGCIKYPDHRLCRPLNIKERTIIKYIPKEPPGMGLLEAGKRGLVPHHLYVEKREIGKAYKRMNKDGLLPTVITRPSPHDSRGGPSVHWAQDRPITIEEARVAQGIPQDDVIIGSTAEQIKQVGNAVDRRVSEALGLALRYTVEGCPIEVLNADRISGYGSVNRALTQRRSLVCVRIPSFSSRLGQDFELIKHMPVATIEENDALGSESSSSDSTQSVIQVGSLSRLELVEDQDTPEPGFDTADSAEEAEIGNQINIAEKIDTNGPTQAALPSDAPTQQGSMLGRLSRTFSQGVGLLPPSFSPSTVVPLRGKRSHHSGVSLTMDHESYGTSPPNKRARTSTGWNPLVALPSGISSSSGSSPPSDKLHQSDSSTPPGHSAPTSSTPSSGGSPAVGNSPTPEETPAAEVFSISTEATVRPQTEPTRPAPNTTTAPKRMQRKTRHSGLAADAGPTVWSKVPEREIQRARELVRRKSQSYA
jgi:DNA (cytosine-5)-methyltransferase 1